ncbi:hypothetical protein [Xanthomonas phage JGB6]|nr:hypothetical protein [Xanthomonas phage JGB6]
MAKYSAEVKSVSEMTDAEYRTCVRSGYRSGYIRDDLRQARAGEFEQGAPHFVSLVKDEKGHVRAWGMVSHWNHSQPWLKGKQAMLQLWTQRRYRRKGLGTMVVEAVRGKLDTKFDVYRTENVPFFNAVNL